MKETIQLLRHAENTLQSVRVRAVDMPTDGSAILSAIREIQEAADKLERMQNTREPAGDAGGRP